MIQVELINDVILDESWVPKFKFTIGEKEFDSKESALDAYNNGIDCDSCGGHGYHDGWGSNSVCPSCKGKGKLKYCEDEEEWSWFHG